MNLLNLLVYGPLGGAQKRKPDVIHAITIESGTPGVLKGQTVTAACGARHVRFVSDADRRVLLWPIRAAGPFTRCRECWVATGKKRPRQAATNGGSQAQEQEG